MGSKKYYPIMKQAWVRFTLPLKRPIKSFASLWSPRIVERFRSLLVNRFVKDLDFSDCVFVGLGHQKRPVVWETALERLNIQSHTEITYYEFGVFNGDSLRWWTERNSNPASQFFGFDSFEGIPEPWIPARKSVGSYRTIPGSLDDLDDRITLVPGWFSTSVPRFFSNTACQPRQ